MRFDSARAAGLTEERADQVRDDYAENVAPAEAAALALTDAFIGDPDSLDETTKEALVAHYDNGELAELALGVGLFFGLSKVLVALGLEPESMPTTVLPAPGSEPAQ